MKLLEREGGAVLRLVGLGQLRRLLRAFVADLANVSEGDIKQMNMKPIHANKLRHLREKEKERQAAAAETPLEPDEPSPPLSTPAQPPAVCAQARDAGTRIARAVGEYVGDDAVAAAFQPLMGVHAAAMAPEVWISSHFSGLALPPSVDIPLFALEHLSSVCSASFSLMENG